MNTNAASSLRGAIEVTVNVDGRKFIVTLSPDGAPLLIKERRVHAPGKPWECLCNKSYWHAKHHKIGGPETMVARIVAAAQKSSL